ncbi:PKD domain-containing protein [Arcticibacter eurypsychrophilus]|uniref:PKD domain-containing protein n=1 Tax=Arcticibacter eurypsychrophilus TaxID=1434752 RepID=UPI00084DF07D|nr:PKD domain-containing protein [Arcticibacter eurypsychrophilus]
MKKIYKNTVLLTLFTVTLLLGSCKDDDQVLPVTDVIYDLAVDGNQVTFTNKTNAASYTWDFGDGTTSTEESPVHVYPGKGKYVATLVATVTGGATAEGSTVIRISKSSPVKLNDNSLDDWNTVTANVITSGTGGGTFRTVKYDYDGNYVYVYVEMVSKRANGDIFDLYMDTDNSAGTGLLTSAFPDGGYDVLLEGQLLAAGLDVFYHKGAQTDFSFDQQSISDFLQIGTVTESANGLLRFEFRLARGKLKGLMGQALRIGMTATKSDWSVTLGSAPDAGASGYLIPMAD